MGRYKKKKLKMPEDGLPGICVDGHAKGLSVKVKSPIELIVIPLPANFAYSAVIYRATQDVNQMGEVVCHQLQMIKRRNNGTWNGAS
jgi:hypothetical protein